ncbi:MAG: ATP-binding protein [Kangiellaceae bacterium]|nr:ATP-binding protein [Kangiellaceae bacterium]
MKSLERQLQTSLAVVLLLILLGLVIVANLSTRSLLEEFVTSRLELDAKRILDTLETSAQQPKVRWGRINPVYNTPDSGHYYAIKLNGAPNILFSPSLKNEALSIPLDSELKHDEATIVHDAIGPKGQHLIIWTKAYSKDGQSIVISIAEDMSLLMKNRQHFSLLFIGIGLVGFFLMLALQRFVIRRLFKHLDKSRQEIQQIESGERQQLSEDVPAEIYPLVKEFNHSLSLMQQRMERSRNSLGNLAHALKTPLSLLMQELDSGDGEKSLKQAKRQAERIRQLTDRELKRARLAGLGNTTQRFDPREELPTLIDVLKQAHQKANLNVGLNIDDAVKVFGDREDMLELMGNLMDNAYKWATHKIKLTINLDSNLHIRIEDDGPGTELDKINELSKRGVRLDEKIQGHGFGLAITADIVSDYNGNIRFKHSDELGGFQADITLKLNRP